MIDTLLHKKESRGIHGFLILRMISSSVIPNFSNSWNLSVISSKSQFFFSSITLDMASRINVPFVEIVVMTCLLSNRS